MNDMPSLPRILRYLSFSLFAALCFFIPHATRAFEKISSMDVHARLEAPHLFSVEERITYDFGSTRRHGIFRFIPLIQTKDGYRTSLRIELDKVERDGNVEPYALSTTGGVWNAKIGDPDKTIVGTHEYELRYHTDRAVRFFDDHDELYWNVTGNEWPVAIQEARFFLDVPPEIIAQTTSTCFTGITGSTEQACRITVASSTIQVVVTRPLQMHEGLTVAVSLPKGFFTPPTAGETVLAMMPNEWVSGVPVLALILMLGLWVRYGRDPRIPTVIPEYEPPEQMSPGVMDAVFHNERISSKGVTATLLDLARRGHLHIRFDTKDRLIGPDKQLFTFIRHTSDERLFVAEQRIVDAIFLDGDEVSTASLAKSADFHEAIKKWKESVISEVKQLGVFDITPTAARSLSVFVAMVVGIALITLGGQTTMSFISASVTAVIIIGFGYTMSRRSKKGTELYAKISGFRWFLSVTETDRLAFHQAPERKPEEFYRLLPYAIVLGVEKEWAKQFASFVLPPPTWAEGNVSLTSIAYVSSLQSFHSAAASTYSDASSSGFSGGSSGGGSGGGGGGSW